MHTCCSHYITCARASTTAPQEIRRVRGKPSAAFQAELGYSGSEEVVFRGNTALLDAARLDAGGVASPGAATEGEEEDDDDWAPSSLKDGLLASAAAAAMASGSGSAAARMLAEQRAPRPAEVSAPREALDAAGALAAER
jgi:hypothetical protein